MTNYEHYKDEIDKIARMGRTVVFDKKKQKITMCCLTSCTNCAFHSPNVTKSCSEVAVEWAEAEYIEPEVNWYEVPIDTPILVKGECDVTWVRRYFAGLNAEGRVTAWGVGRTSWSVSTPGDRVVWTYAKLARREYERI